MNVLDVSHCNQLNGDGLRVVLWVSGCSHKCENCQNSYSWNEELGEKFTNTTKDEIFQELSQDWCSGITYSGGDPLFAINREEIIALAKEIREKFPNKTQWLYTGYTWQEVIEDSTMNEVLKYIDVICVGRYEHALRDVTLEWVGSTNQQVIDVKKRFETISRLSIG